MTPAWLEMLPRVWGTDTSLPLCPGKPSLLLLICCCAEAALLQLSSQDQGFSLPDQRQQLLQMLGRLGIHP